MLQTLRRKIHPSLLRNTFRKLSLSPKQLRNVGIVAHIDAGKTTTTEQMLYLSGETKSVGRVDTGDTIMDFLPEERERGITISAAAISFTWKDRFINLIDTPGHVDFTIEVERSVRVLDGSVVIVDAVAGVQAQTQTVWRQVRKQNTPSIAFINKMDRDGANFEQAVESLKSKLGVPTIPIQMPLGSEDNFQGVVDLLTLRQIIWQDNTGDIRRPGAPLLTNLSPSDSVYEAAQKRRLEMLESIAMYDDEFMESYMEQDDKVSIESILTALKRLTFESKVVPTLCGASLRGKGVEPLLDSIITFLPSPEERSNFKAVHSGTGKQKELSATGTPDVCALVFKVVSDAARGPLCFTRVFSGKITAKQNLFNSSKKTRERVNQLLSVSADDLDTLDAAGPGSVCCLVGLRNTKTGDTLVVEKSPLHNYVLDGLTIPKPVFSLAIEPDSSSQEKALEEALAIVALEDPSIQVEVDKESGQTMLRGLGELHLEVVCNRLRRQFGLEVTTGRAYVAYRESLDKTYFDSPTFTIEQTYDKIIAGKRLFAHLKFDVTLVGSADDPIITVKDKNVDQLTVDEQQALYDGLISACTRGPRGFPIVGMNVSVSGAQRDGTFTTPGAVRACAAIFMDKLLRSEAKLLMEPIMSLEIQVPSLFVGDVLSDLTVNRRAHIKEISESGIESVNSQSTVVAMVPLAKLLGYASTLRSLTQGEGSFSAEFNTYQSVDAADML